MTDQVNPLEKAVVPPTCSVIQAAVLRALPALGLPARAQILDAPCGDGALASALREQGFEVWGADVDAAAQQWLGDRFMIADLNQPLPYPEARFDALFCIEGLEHLENRFFFLREAHRVLRPGGLLLVTTPNIASLRSRVRFLGSAFYHKDPRPLNESRRHPLHHINLATFSDIRYALNTAGFCLNQFGHTHTKKVSYLYSVLAPWMWCYTTIAFRKEKDSVQRRRNREIRRTLFSRSVLFGENLILLARKV